MATLSVPSEFPNIADAMAAAQPGDIIALETGYAGESASVTVENITVQGDATNTGIVLTLAAGIAQVVLAGSAPIDIGGNAGPNTVVGNAGSNALDGSDGDDLINAGTGVDDVDGGAGSDRLIVDYSASSTNFGGGIENGSLAEGYQGNWHDSADNSIAFSGIESFSITTGSGDDIVPTGDGDDTIATGTGNDDVAGGGGNDTIDPGTGSDLVDGGLGTDRLIVDYSGVSLSVTFQVTGGSTAAGFGGSVTDSINGLQFFGIENFSITTGGGNDTIRTGGGDDTMTAGGGDDILDGGDGTDIAVFGGDRQDYTITPNADGSVQVTDQRAGAPDGSDRLLFVDLAQFSDETVDINYVPVADHDSYELNENTVLVVAAPGVLEGDGDANDDTLRAALVNGPAHGDVMFNADGSFTYTPDADYFGPDSFTYRANDGAADSNVATVTLTIKEAPRPPVVDAGADRTAAEGQTVNLAATFTDPDLSDTHTATIAWGDGTSTTGIVAAGRVTGSHAYADNGAYTITTMVTDNTGRSGTDTLVATIGNVAPVAQSLTLSGPVEDGPTKTFNFGATDAGSADTLLFTILTSPSEGVVTNNANGTFTFDPGSAFQDLRQGETRAVSFTYRATDDDGANSAPATVIINVAGVGSRTDTVGDPLNQHPWSTQVSIYDDANRLVSHIVDYDDGSHVVAGFDTLNERDSFEFVAGYDGRWNKTYEDTRYDDGSLVTYVRDALDQYDWTDALNIYDNLGRKISEEQTRDDGSQWAWNFDTADEFDWSDEFATYDGQGNKLSERKTWDDGRTTDWHPPSESQWSGPGGLPSFGAAASDFDQLR